MEPEIPAVSRSYVRLYQIASGGLGVVDLVMRRDAAFERLYAMKRLHPQYLEDATIRAMFLEEARIAGLLQHPNVVAVHDFGEDSYGPFLVMDYIEGVSLSTAMTQLTEGEMFPVQLCIKLAIQVARGLHAAHELTSHDGQRLVLVHRDVSPQNILIGFDGVVKIIDFGIAKILGVDTLTSTGVLKGKLGYMSPEQLRYEAIDRRSDLFALGVVLFEMLGSERLYDPRSSSNTPHRILNESPPDISDLRRDVPPSLVQLLFDLLAKNREDRPADALVVARRLEAIAEEIGEDEEPLELETFLDESYSPLRATLRERVRKAVAGLPADIDAPPWDTQTPDEGTHANTIPMLPSPPRMVTKRRNRLIVALALVVLLSSVAIVVLGVGSLMTENRDMGLEGPHNDVENEGVDRSSLIRPTRSSPSQELDSGAVETHPEIPEGLLEASVPQATDAGDEGDSASRRSRRRALRGKRSNVGQGKAKRSGQWMSW